MNTATKLGRLALLISLWSLGVSLSAQSTAVRTITNNNTASPHVSLLATPTATVSTYAVEEALPAGLAPSNINESGAWDAVNRKVKWGLFFDHTVRTLTYDVTGTPGTYTVTGKGNFDGTDVTTTGDNQFEILPDAVQAPTFDPPAPQTFATSMEVTISCATTDATICYTTNGTEPTSESTPYSPPLTLTATTELKARAFKPGMTDSPVTSGTYMKDEHVTAAHAVVGPGYRAGGTCSVRSTVQFTGSPSALGWSVTIPPGWSYAGGSGEPGTKPEVGDLGTLEWTWTAVPSSPAEFTYTLDVPAGEQGSKSIAAVAKYRLGGGPLQVTAEPNPLTIHEVRSHSADTGVGEVPGGCNNRISQDELMRVIQFYNCRSGATRTGEYYVHNGTEDGYDPGPGAQDGPPHAADTGVGEDPDLELEPNWRISQDELMRVIQIYNYRSGATRTGEYHVQAGTEDGYAPGPVTRGQEGPDAGTRALTVASHTAGSACYTAGSTLVVTCSFAYDGAASSLGWSASVPPGWCYAGGTDEPGTKPLPGDQGVLEWTWTGVPASPVTFSYTLTVPADETGAQEIIGLAKFRDAISGPQSLAATPNALLLEPQVATVVRTITGNGTVGPHVSLVVTPSPAVSAYAVEDALPAGLTPSSISESGAWDAVNRKVKWGLFFDHTVRTLTYDVTGTPDTYTVTGKGNFDGTDVTTTGDSQLTVGLPQATVTFRSGVHGNLAGGAPDVTVIVDHGDPPPAAPAVTSEACWQFTGWSPPLPAVITEDVETTAQYERTLFTVTFHAGEHGTLAEGTPDVTRTVNCGDPAPAAPTVTPEAGWLFTSWSPTLPAVITADVETTAQYTRVTCTVTFQPGAHGTLAGGTPTVTVTVTHGDPAPTPPALTPEACWQFTGWSPPLPALITDDVETTAQYERTLFTVTFRAGEHGTLAEGTPDVAKTVNCGDPAPAVPAVTPDAGWLFTGWSPELPVVIGQDVETTAQYAAVPSAVVRTITGNGTVGPHVSLLATPAATVSAYAVEDALPTGLTPSNISESGAWDAVNRKVKWALFVDDNVRTLTYDVTGTPGTYMLAGRGSFDGTDALTTGDSLVTMPPTVTFRPGAHGSLAGGTPAVAVTVNHGEPAPTAPAVTPEACWQFTGWSPALPALITDDVETTAQYERTFFTVTFQPGDHGTLAEGTPDVTETVNCGDPAPAAPAVAPEAGWLFTGWSLALPAVITADVETTAQYDVAGPVPPDGRFEARLDAAGVTSGQGLWDLTGPYSTNVGANQLKLSLIHDTNGRLTGTGVFTLTGAVPVDVPVVVRGSVKGKGGALVATMALKGANAASKASISLSFNLSLNAATLKLNGPVTGSLKVNGVTTTVSETVTLNLPASMAGTWTLLLQLVQSARDITGTARLTLSNGVHFTYTVQGRTRGQAAVLSLAGDPADPAAKGIKIRTTITPLEGGWARLESFSGRGYGQTVGW